MSKFYLAITFVLYFSSIEAQYSISGSILNQENQAVELVEIVVLSQDFIAKTSELTDGKGAFLVSIAEKGTYILQIRQIGVLLYSTELDVINDTNLGIIKINESQEQLEEVLVEGRKKLIERKVDRLVFNVENSISATGGDALDALRVTPGIRVQNDAVSMIGKSGMAVMVDDRIIQLSDDDLVNFLKTISSDNIKSIEVITTPPAKYDAEGNSGLINIKLKTVKTDSWSGTLRSVYKQATYATGLLGGNFSYQKNKFSLLMDLSKLNGENIYTNKINYQYPTENWRSDIYNKTSSDNLSSLLVIGYDLTGKTKIGIQYLGNFNTPTINENNVTDIFANNTDHLDKRLVSKGDVDLNVKSHSLNFNLITKIDTLGKKMTVDVDYFAYNSCKDNVFKSTNADYLIPTVVKSHTDNNNNQDINNFSSKIDFEMPYQWANVSYGAKISFTNSNSDVKANFYDTTTDDFILNLSQKNQFDYKERLQAVYFSANKEINEKWEVKIGLRTEFTQTIGYSETEKQRNKKDYYKFFPTAYLSYKKDENNVFSISYSRRVDRPSYSNLNPARWYLNLNSYEEGNPFLQPSFSNNIELSHSYRDLLTTTISFSKIEDEFGQLTIHDIPNDIQVFIRRNYYNYNLLRLSEYVNYDIFQWWSTTLDLSVYYIDTDSYSEYLQSKYSGWGGYSSTTNSFQINKSKTISAQLIYGYSYPSIFNESKTDSYSNLSIALKFLCFGKNLQFSVNTNNILGSDRAKLSNITQGVSQNFKQYYDSQYIRFTMSYKFGNINLKINRKNTGNEEEKDRTN